MKKFLEKIYGEYSDFINFACKYTLNKFPNKYAFITKKQKYNLQIIIIEMIYILKSGISYENYRGNLKYYFKLFNYINIINIILI